MQSCLGIYIEENLIKYAKVQKEKDNIKIEAFGTKFYENIEQAIDQIVAETNSTKIPISINITEEKYDYFQVFALLNKQALKKSMDIEFEMLCGEKGINKDSMEKRYIFVLNKEDPDKMKAINVSVRKDILEREIELFEKYNLTTVEPLPVGIANLVNPDINKNELIVNMEETTTLTFLENGQIQHIDKTKSSIKEALIKMSRAENSETKAYELLKNTTISSQDMEILQEGNEYIDTVVPVLFNMLNEIKEKIAEFGKPVKKIYFTGTGIVINNVDMYFQDRLNDIKCEILKPSFINSQSLKIGIKDYIEVNSAISLALSGMGIGTTNELNFSNKTLIGSNGIDLQAGSGKIKSLKETSNQKFDAFEKLMVRISLVCIIFVLFYVGITKTIMDDMNTKLVDTGSKIEETKKSIQAMEKNRDSIEYLTSEYKTQISRLNNEYLNTEEETIFRERELPNFLTRLSTTMPTEVKLVSIENTQDRHIVIQAKSLKYQQIGYFQLILKTNNILTNVSGSTGIRYHDEETNEDYILVTIEGDLV